MKLLKKLVYQKRPAAAFILSTIFVAVFSTLAMAIAAITGTNVQLADNQRNVNSALCAAQSGLDIMRHHLADVVIPNSVSPDDRLQAVATTLGNNLAGASVTNITTNYDDAAGTLTVAGVSLDSQSNQSFTVVVTQPDDETIQMNVTGSDGQISRTIAVQFKFDVIGSPIFDYGVATRGPLRLYGDIEVGGVNEAAESNIYIESDYNPALYISGGGQIAGDISITNSGDAADIVDIDGGHGSIGGETGHAAIDNHVSTGVPETEFPVPDPTYFEQYVTNTIDPATYESQSTFENIRIPPNTNPTFAGGVTLKGIIYIETPNVVTFAGHANIIGIIVGNGDVEDDSGENRIICNGNVSSSSVSELPAEPQFDQLREETGTFLMAPGFMLAMSGNFSTLNGTIAANGISFYGNAGGTIEGSVINYSDTPMYIAGDDIYFNRPDTTQIPAGFSNDQALTFQPTSYSEISL